MGTRKIPSTFELMRGAEIREQIEAAEAASDERYLSSLKPGDRRKIEAHNGLLAACKAAELALENWTGSRSDSTRDHALAMLRAAIERAEERA